MLIYARIILILILITSVLQVVGGVVMLKVDPSVALFSIAFSGLIVWLAYANYVDATKCANM